MPAPPRTDPAVRTRLLGLAVGALALLALVGLAVVLPRLGGSTADAAGAPGGSSGASTAAGGASAASGDGVEVTLPESVAGFTASTAGDDAAATELRGRLDSAASELQQTYGVPVSVGLYAGDAGADDQRSAVVTALSAPAGLFLPSGPAPEPSMLQLARNQAVLARVGDAVCSSVYSAPVPEGQDVDETEVPQGVQCQGTTDGVTYQVDGSAMSAQEAVDLLDAIAAVQG